MSFAQLLALIVPPACVACGLPLQVADALVCPGCMADLRWLGAAVCRRCGLPGHGGRACPAADAPFATAWAPLAHQGTAQALVRALKFDGALPVAGLMAAQIAANAPPWALGAGALGPGGVARRGPCAGGGVAGGGVAGGGVALAIVPVPAAPARRRRRGFDPAALIARELGRRLHLPVADCLARSGRAARQLGARRAERLEGGRIAVDTVRPPPAAALLVDDVHTTGATLRACAAALRQNGTNHVQALSYVRAL